LYHNGAVVSEVELCATFYYRDTEICKRTLRSDEEIYGWRLENDQKTAFSFFALRCSFAVRPCLAKLNDAVVLA